MFHPDKIDWLETTPDGENTSNLLGLSVFQPRINEKCEPIILDLENTQSLTLIQPASRLWGTYKRNDALS